MLHGGGSSRTVPNRRGVAWLHRFVEQLQVSLIDPDGRNALPLLGRVLRAVPPPPTRVADLCARQLLETILLRVAAKSPDAASELVTVAADLCDVDWTTMAARLESLRVAASPSSSLIPSLAYRTKAYLDSNYRTPCRLVDVARSVGASTRLVTREFSAEYGRGIHQYLIVVRLKAALDMLSTSDEKIASIAAAVGFGHVSVLYRHLHALCGAPPGVFRGSPPAAVAAKVRLESDRATSPINEPRTCRADDDSVIA
jgi:AraC-like DNA-binding protein